MNRLLRERRLRVPLTQEELADRVGVSAMSIRRWEAGLNPQPVHVRRLMDVLKATPDELGFDATPPEPPAPSLLRAIGVPGDADPDLAALDAFRVADRQIGGGHLYAAVLSYLKASIGPRLLTGPTAPFAAAASLTEMAGWMAHDSGHDETARAHFDRAWELAQVGQAVALQGDVAAARSHLELHLGRPASAVEIARHGRERLARGPRHPGLTARLCAMEGRGLSELGRKAESIRSFSWAEHALGAPDGDASPWVAPFDEASLAGETARGLHAIRDFQGARRAAERVIELRQGDRTRSRAFARLSLALTLLCGPRPEPVEACTLACLVADQAATVASVRIGRQLREIGELLQPYHHVREVAEFLEVNGHGGRMTT